MTLEEENAAVDAIMREVAWDVVERRSADRRIELSLPPTVELRAARVDRRGRIGTSDSQPFRRADTMNKADFDAAMDKIDAETTRIGTGVLALLAKLAAGGMTDAEEKAAIERASGLAERLKGIAVDHEDPVPDPIPEDGEGEGDGGGDGTVGRRR